MANEKDKGKGYIKSMAEACRRIDEFMGCVDDGPFGNSPFREVPKLPTAPGLITEIGHGADEVDYVNHPPHYKGFLLQLGDNPLTTGRDTMKWLRHTFEYGRRIYIEVQCIDVIRNITDIRLATAVKYIWRVAFGGKFNNVEDIKKAIWYLNDWLDNQIVDGRVQVSVDEGAGEH